MSERRVVVTGIGLFSPIGIGHQDFEENLLTGKSGVRTIESIPHTAVPGNVGAEVPGFSDSEAKQYLRPVRKSIKVMCRDIQLGVASAIQAFEHSGLDPDAIDHTRLGIDFGANQMLSPPEVLRPAAYACLNPETGEFEYHRWGTDGLANMEPLWLLKYLPNMPACHIAIFADSRGPNNSLTLAEASGNAVIGEAMRVIQRGHADMMITGSTGSRIHAVKCLHAMLWEEIARGEGPPETWCRPFDVNRSGQVIGEGAATFILEEEEHARARGATIWGRILGTGSSCATTPDGQTDRRRALANAMRIALRDAGLTPQDIGHINAHGLGERVGDREEAAAIRDVFGDLADTIPVTSLKGYLGNSGAACGTLELAGSLLALRKGVIPHTINCDEPDPECGLNIVRGQPQPAKNKVVMNLNVTLVGQAAVAIAEGV